MAATPGSGDRSIDWDDFRFALAVARHGTLSAASRALGTTQPTVSRRLSALEKRIGARLFRRTADGLEPTELCRSLLDPLERMDEQAQAVQRRIAARDTGLEGGITLTSLAWFGDEVLAPLLARFVVNHPRVAIDMINDPRRIDLSRREADVAVRIGLFYQDDLIERTVAEVSYGLYAAPAYLKREGEPAFADGCSGHKLVSLSDPSPTVVHIEWLMRIAPRAAVVLRTNNIQSHIVTAEAGDALAVLPRVLADQRKTLVRIKPPLPEPFNPVKLGIHPDLRATPRIRALVEFLTKELAVRASDLRPPT